MRLFLQWLGGLCCRFNPRVGVLAVLALAPCLELAAAGPKVTESFSMEIIGLPLDHQGPQVTDLLIHLTYVADIAQQDIPDFEVILKEIKAFLAAYPNEKDYIEVVNRKLCLDVLGRYAAFSAVAVDIRLYPTMTIPYAQTSHCVAAR